MEYVHAALLLHSAGKPVDEAALTKVIDATGEKADGSRVKALVAALDGVDIKAAIEKAVAVPAVVAAAPAAGGAAAPAKEEKKEEKNEEQAAEGLSSLFG